MTLQGQVLDRVAVCTSRVAANNYFSVSQSDIDTTVLEAGDNVRVRLTKVSEESSPNPRDSDIYDSTLQKSNQVYIPSDTRDKLELETGDNIKYVVIPKKAFPGVEDGPVRNKAKQVINGGSEEEQETEGLERPERETSTDTFDSSPMQKTGQITVPADTMDKMGLLQGDTVMVSVKWKGEDKTMNKDIGTGNRITLAKDERTELGLEPGDKPQVRLSVFD